MDPDLRGAWRALARGATISSEPCLRVTGRRTSRDCHTIGPSSNLHRPQVDEWRGNRVWTEQGSLHDRIGLH